jgi:hypothetical protein
MTPGSSALACGASLCALLPAHPSDRSCAFTALPDLREGSRSTLRSRCTLLASIHHPDVTHSIRKSRFLVQNRTFASRSASKLIYRARGEFVEVVFGNRTPKSPTRTKAPGSAIYVRIDLSPVKVMPATLQGSPCPEDRCRLPVSRYQSAAWPVTWPAP